MTTLDTTGEVGDQAGYSARDFPILDRQEGFSAFLSSQITEEVHINQNRAGFSLLVLSDDLLGIELAFWANEIWAQRGGEGKMFTHGEGVVYDTTVALGTYELRILDDSYTLLVGEEVILSGPLRDYSSFTGFPNPYITPNFIFMGDNTTSAGAVVDIAYMALETTADATARRQRQLPARTRQRSLARIRQAQRPRLRSLRGLPIPRDIAPHPNAAAPNGYPEATRGPFWWLPCINN